MTDRVEFWTNLQNDLEKDYAKADPNNPKIVMTFERDGKVFKTFYDNRTCKVEDDVYSSLTLVK